MRVTIEHIEQGFMNWFTNEIATLDWKMALTLPLVRIGISNFKNKNSGLIASLLDSEGFIDVDLLHKDYASILNAKGHIEIASVKLDTKDLDSLVNYIKNTAPPVQSNKPILPTQQPVTNDMTGGRV